MGYTHGKRWNDVEIEKCILGVMDDLEIDRMPSVSEMNSVRNSADLSSTISKKGGFRWWSKKLNLNMKKSCTEKAYYYEKRTKYIIEGIGHKAFLTPTKFPYDILVDDCLKIDVKLSKGWHNDRVSFYSFNLEYAYPKCDLYIFYCVDNDLGYKTLVIPSHILTGKVQISVGKKSMYDEYKDRWEYIEMYLNFFGNVRD